MKRADSGLEKQWLQFLEQNNLRLPTSAQKFFPECQTRPDFYYEDENAKVAIYVDGPPHDYPERQQRDQAQGDCMMNAGYLVIRFKHTDDWQNVIAEFPSVYGKVN
jgi:very-short-patch-repair endonuclease